MNTRLVICCLVILSGCVSSSPRPEIVSSKVTVSTSGKEVTDFDSEFIHRAAVTSKELVRISHFDEVKDSYDQFGKVVGLQLTSDLPVLALRQGDVLTAIGKKVVKPGDRLDILTSQVSKGESSITFLRKGRPYKTLIQVR